MIPHNPEESSFKKVFPSWVWILYLILFAFSIPWYLPETLSMNLVLGLPLWLVCSVISVVLIAIFTQWIIIKYWIDSE